MLARRLWKNSKNFGFFRPNTAYRWVGALFVGLGSGLRFGSRVAANMLCTVGYSCVCVCVCACVCVRVCTEPVCLPHTCTHQLLKRHHAVAIGVGLLDQFAPLHIWDAMLSVVSRRNVWVVYVMILRYAVL